MTNIIDAVKDNIKGVIVTTLAGLVIAAGVTVFEWTQYGARAEANRALDARVMSVILSDSTQIKFLQQPKVKEFVHKIRLEAYEDAVHQDSLKVKMSVYLSSSTGMTKEALMDSLAVLLNGIKQGRPITNIQCINNCMLHTERTLLPTL